MTEYTQTDKKIPLKAEIRGEAKPDTAGITESADGEIPVIPPEFEAQPVKEIKFFSDPKAVKKKTQGSITVFQIIFTVLFCLVCKLTELLAPELYLNISTYLERLLRW